MSVFFKIRLALNEKRLLKTFRKKLYPYIKGLLLIFKNKKNQINLHITKLNKIDKSDLHLAERIFSSYQKMKIEQKKNLTFTSLPPCGRNILTRILNF